MHLPNWTCQRHYENGFSFVYWLGSRGMMSSGNQKLMSLERKGSWPLDIEHSNEQISLVQPLLISLEIGCHPSICSLVQRGCLVDDKLRPELEPSSGEVVEIRLEAARFNVKPESECKCEGTSKFVLVTRIHQKSPILGLWEWLVNSYKDSILIINVKFLHIEQITFFSFSVTDWPDVVLMTPNYAWTRSDSLPRHKNYHSQTISRHKLMTFEEFLGSNDTSLIIIPKQTHESFQNQWLLGAMSSSYTTNWSEWKC